MKTRAEVVKFISDQMVFNVCAEERTVMGFSKGGHHHYGKQELRELMDFIYEGKPTGSGCDVV